MFRRSLSLFAAALLAVATLGLSACNTMSGAGKDLSAAGHDMTHVSGSTQDKIVDKTGAAKD